jgi:hypothetical protein
LQRNFGEEYSLTGIRRRILEQQSPARPAPKPKQQLRIFLLHGKFSSAKRLKGFRALYVHYLCLLGKLPKNRLRPPEKIAPVHRGELLKIDQLSRELQLLCRYQIDTPEQLSAFRDKASKKEAALCDRILQRVEIMHVNMRLEKKDRSEMQHAIRRSR